MKDTNYTFNNQKVSYEVNSNGYSIFLDEELWITQNKNEYVPYPELSLEECCLKQIEEIVNANKQTSSMKETVDLEKLRSDVDYIALVNDIDLGGNE